MSLFAYIDPGTGSMIIQALIGAVAGIAFFSRSMIRQLMTKVRMTFSKSESQETED